MSRWNMIEPVLYKPIVMNISVAAERRKHAPSEDRRPVDLRWREDEVEPPARAVVQRRRGGKGEHGECLLQTVPVLLAEGIVRVEATEI